MTSTSTANVIALLAQNRYQIVAGGISAGIFNALEKNLPITILSDRVSTPIGHNLMLRPDLKDKVKSLKDLKGKVIASNGQGSVSTYEIGKMLERDGLTHRRRRAQDPAVPADGRSRFKNEAIDAAHRHPAVRLAARGAGIAVPFARVGRAGHAAADDHRRHHGQHAIGRRANPELVQNYMTAWLRGVRDYCQAYHGAPNRQEIIDELVNTKTAPSRALLEKYPWPARSPNGKINTASMLDINKWYVKNKMSAKEFPAERLVDSSYIDHAIAKLGPFELQNKDSKLPGCR